MRHEDCNNWDYATHPAVKTVEDECTAILTELKASPGVFQSGLSDTRALHKRIFQQTAPSACVCVAGNYRGADFDCLRAAPMYFGKNSGTPPVSVSIAIGDMHDEMNAAVVALDQAHAATATATNKEKAVLLSRLVSLAASALVRFFSIHPYMNGNGHMGRLIVWILLARYGRLPTRWTLHKSPPGYSDLLDLYRAGKHKPLERFMLECIIG